MSRPAAVPSAHSSRMSVGTSHAVKIVDVNTTACLTHA
jgi:hypothetical protein